MNFSTIARHRADGPFPLTPRGDHASGASCPGTGQHEDACPRCHPFSYAIETARHRAERAA